MNIYALEEFLTDNHIDFVELDKKEKWRIQQSWRERYSVEIKMETGKWSIDGTDWCTFSAGHHVCLDGSRAETAYSLLTGNSFILISSNNQIPGYRCRAQKLPALDQLHKLLYEETMLIDLYIFDTELKWTFVITHEPNFGPYFSSDDLLEPSFSSDDL